MNEDKLGGRSIFLTTVLRALVRYCVSVALKSLGSHYRYPRNASTNTACRGSQWSFRLEANDHLINIFIPETIPDLIHHGSWRCGEQRVEPWLG